MRNERGDEMMFCPKCKRRLYDTESGVEWENENWNGVQALIKRSFNCINEKCRWFEKSITVNLVAWDFAAYDDEGEEEIILSKISKKLKCRIT